MAQKGMSEILSKVRVPKKTKQAAAMNEAYEPTQTAIQYWQTVEVELAKRKAAYEKAIEAFKALGGTAQGVGDNIQVSLHGASVTVEMNEEGRILAIDSHIPVKAEHEDMVSISNATLAIIGLGKSEECQRQIKELRSYVENDGYIIGMNALVNKTVLQNPVLTALTMVPEDARARQTEE